MKKEAREKIRIAEGRNDKGEKSARVHVRARMSTRPSACPLGRHVRAGEDERKRESIDPPPSLQELGNP